MTYTLTQTSAIIRNADGAAIPADPLNMDYAAYLAWVEAGGVPNPAPTPPAPVPSCQLWQLQAVMPPAQWASVMAAVAALNNPTVSAFVAHGTNVMPANSTTVLALGAAIGLTPDQVTALVAQASTIVIP
jgi:hypothetical protein